MAGLCLVCAEYMLDDEWKDWGCHERGIWLEFWGSELPVVVGTACSMPGIQGLLGSQ